jgi:hypothetical protein
MRTERRASANMNQGLIEEPGAQERRRFTCQHDTAYMLMDLGHHALELPSSESFARQLRPQEANQDNRYNASPAECATGLHGDTENFRIEQPGR